MKATDRHVPFGKPEDLTNEEIVRRARWLYSVFERLDDPVRAAALLHGMPADSKDLRSFRLFNEGWLKDAERVARSREPSFSVTGLPTFTDEEFEEVQSPVKTIEEIFEDRISLTMFKVNLELRKRDSAYPRSYNNLGVRLTINSLEEMNALIERCVARLQKFDEDEGPDPAVQEILRVCG